MKWIVMLFWVGFWVFMMVGTIILFSYLYHHGPEWLSKSGRRTPSLAIVVIQSILYIFYLVTGFIGVGAILESKIPEDLKLTK